MCLAAFELSYKKFAIFFEETRPDKAPDMVSILTIEKKHIV